MTRLSRLLGCLYSAEEHLSSLCRGSNKASLEVGDARRNLLHEIQGIKKKIATEDKRLAREKKKWTR